MRSSNLKRSLLTVCATSLLALSLQSPAIADEQTDTVDENGRTCFWLSNVTDWRAIDNRHVYVRGVGEKQRYLLTLMNYCQGIRFAETIALQTRPTSRLCDNGNERLTVIDHSSFNTSCLITDVERVADIDTAREIVEAREAE